MVAAASTSPRGSVRRDLSYAFADNLSAVTFSLYAKGGGNRIRSLLGGGGVYVINKLAAEGALAVDIDGYLVVADRDRDIDQGRALSTPASEPAMPSS